MLSAKLARRARPPLGVCQPQGLVLPLTSVVDRMMSLSGCLMVSLTAAATARTRTARTTNDRATRTREDKDRRDTNSPEKVGNARPEPRYEVPSGMDSKSRSRKASSQRGRLSLGQRRFCRPLIYAPFGYFEMASPDGIRRPDPG